MKTTIVKIVAIAILSSSAFAGSVIQGPPITAANLAKQLGVFSYTLTYKQERPYKSLSFNLSYKERTPDGSYSEKAFLSASTHTFMLPETKTSLTIFVDKEKSMVISDSSSSGGHGYDLGSVYSTRTPPQLRPGGGYILLTTTIDPKETDTEDNIKGILELTLKASE